MSYFFKIRKTILFTYHPEVHPYHNVTPSPWPVSVSFSLLGLVLSIVMFFHEFISWNFQFFFSFILLSVSVFFWFDDIITESKYEGAHSSKVKKNLEFGFAAFIVSEILFFFGFFWAFFHSGLVPVIWIGAVWPPVGLITIDPTGLPLLNTVILLSSGVTVTWAHRALYKKNRKNVIFGLSLTIFYGLLFTACQLIEYNTCWLSIEHTVFGASFFMLTGFHGLHVIIGTFMLAVTLLRHIKYLVDIKKHVGFEISIWYWHFVDVVWLFLYCFIYVLGSGIL